MTLVTGITLEEDEDNFRIASEYVARCLDQTVKPSGSVDMGSVRKHFKGYGSVEIHAFMNGGKNSIMSQADSEGSYHVSRHPRDCS